MPHWGVNSMTELPACEVTWIDSTSFTRSWYEMSEATKKKLQTIRTIGFLLCEDRFQITLVSSYGEEYGEDHTQEVGGLFAIPKGCIVDFRLIEFTDA